MTQKDLTKLSLLFIDTGDTCRCPMACGYLYKLLCQRGINHINIKTCGVMTANEFLATPKTVQLLMDEEIDIGAHRSTLLTVGMLEKADLILAMTPYHIQFINQKFEGYSTKIHLLKEYTGFPKGDHTILDPKGGSMEVYKKTFDEIKMAIDRLVEAEFKSAASL